MNREGLQVSNYRLIRLLENGEFVDIYLGEHIYLKNPVIVKESLQPFSLNDLEEYRQEVGRLMQLEHPHIVRILDGPVVEGTPFLVIDYAPNGSLRQLYPRGSRLPLATTLLYLKQITSALFYAHQKGIVHGNIRPEHILFGSQGEALLGNFTMPLVSRMSYARSILDDPVYTAPEQLRTPDQLLPASDQYALSTMLYEWLCGRCPFAGTPEQIAQQQQFVSPLPLNEIASDISPTVNEAVLKALQKDPQQRYIDVLQLCDAFEQAIQVNLPPERNVIASPTPVAPVSLPSIQSGRSGKMLFILSLVLLLVLGSGLFYYTTYALPNQANRSALKTVSPTVSIEQMSPMQLYSYVTGKPPAFNDPLDGRDPSHWDLSRSSDGGGCAFMQGALHVIISRVNPLPECFVHGGPYANFAFQMQITILSGSDVAAGLLFRAATISTAYYSLYTTTVDSSYVFSKTNPDGTVATDGYFTASNSAIHANLKMPNLLTVIAHGSNFYLYINNIYLNTISDSTYSAGRLGVFVLAKNSTKTEALCRNAKLWLFL